MTYFVPLTRREWAEDQDGIPVISKHADAVERVRVDWSDQMLPDTEAPEEVETSSWTASGVTLTDPSILDGDNIVQVFVSGTDGTATNTVVTSYARTLVQVFRFVGVPLGRGSDDYGNG